MLIRRSIGREEFRLLMEESIIFGQYNCEKECQNNINKKNIVCFYLDKVFWHDNNHIIDIVVDIPRSKLEFGIGSYHAGKQLKEKNIWAGRTGSISYKIREAYCLSYSLKNVKEIYMNGHFANWYIKEEIEPICKKYNIKLQHLYQEPKFEEKEKFVKGIFLPQKEIFGWDYITKDCLDNLGEPPKMSKKEQENYNKEIFIHNTMQQLEDYINTEKNAYELMKSISKLMENE